PSLNIGNFNLSSLTASTQMMRDCSGLKTLTIPSTANKLDNTACVSVGSKFAPCLLDFPSGFTPEKQDQADNNAISQWYQWKSGFFLDVWSYAELTNSGKTLTFYHDKKWNNRTGTIYSINVADNSWSYSEAPTWNNPTISKNITSVVFDSSFANARPTSCVCWFEGMSNLTSISGMASYLNTSRSSSMYRMFKGCSKLTSIDIKNFNTERTAFFDEMFYGCSSLTSLDLSNFKFVLYFEEESQNMLKDCVALKTLTVNKTAGEMAPNACSGVGTKTSPCELIYPSGFTPEKTATGSGWYQWKSGYFKDAPKYPLGDVNHDGSVSIVDASLITEYVLGKTPVVFFIENADVNNDGNVTVTDVSKIIEMVLNNSAASAPATAREAAFDRLWLTANGNHCLLHLDTPEQYNAMHLTLRLPEGGTMGNVRVSSTRSAGHHAEMRPMGGGLYNIVLHASDNAVLRSNDTALLHFDLAGCQPRDVEVVAVQSSNSIFETVMSAGTTTDIQVVETTDDTDGDAYNAAGVRVTKNTRGVVVKNGMKKIK
ncbi:MAG: BspA family leucine-rich repeat surface protein, partial [Prevotella sp.]|nr:BspA family leucine-rich repeat surface protein [Prevotella sp.]